MYKAIYIKPKVNLIQFDNFVDDFITRFSFRNVLKEDQVYYLENEDMSVKILPEVAEILMFDGENRKTIKKVRDYFKN